MKCPALILLMLPCLVGNLHAAADEPIHATVKAVQATVRSGPATAFYATSHLRRGQSVEIYRMTENGWCGIRPPKQSFSWVRQDAVKAAASDSNLLTVTNANAATRVGSSLINKSNVEYTKLRVGETLQSMGRSVRIGPHVWLAVAPPSGEFRWVLQSDLMLTTATSPEAPVAATTSQALTTTRIPARQTISTTAIPPSREPTPAAVEPPVHGTASANPQSAPNATPTEPLKSIMGTVPNEPTASPLVSGPEAVTVASAESAALPATADEADSDAAETTASPPERFPSNMVTTPIPIDPPAERLVEAEGESSDREPMEDPEPSAWTAVATTEITPAAYEAASVAGGDATSPLSVSPAGPNDITPHPSVIEPPAVKRATVAELDAALSHQVERDVTTWQLSPIREQVAALVVESQAPREKYHAQQLLQRIDQFAEVQRRHFDIARAHQQLASGSHGVALATALAPLRRSGVDVLPHMIDAPPVAPPPQAIRTQPPATEPQQRRVAARGMLVPVQAGPGMPRFALTAEDGSIVYFVSPGPGVNLEHYQRRQVEVAGQERTDTEIGQALVAERIQAATTPLR